MKLNISAGYAISFPNMTSMKVSPLQFVPEQAINVLKLSLIKALSIHLYMITIMELQNKKQKEEFRPC